MLVYKRSSITNSQTYEKKPNSQTFDRSISCLNKCLFPKTANVLFRLRLYSHLTRWNQRIMTFLYLKITLNSEQIIKIVSDKSIEALQHIFNLFNKYR